MTTRFGQYADQVPGGSSWSMEDILGEKLHDRCRCMARRTRTQTHDMLVYTDALDAESESHAAAAHDA